MKMPFVDRLERRLGWIAFPKFFRFYALFHVLVFILQLVREDVGQLLEFDRDKVMAGEVWRVVTFLFAASGSQSLSNPVNIIFLLFFVQVAFLISDALEGVWGSFRTTLFAYTGILFLIIGNFFFSFGVSGGGLFLYSTAFLAFATYFPRVEFLLFFVIPVQVRFLAWISVAITLLMAIVLPTTIPFLLAAHMNYLLFVGIPWLRGHRKVVESAIRRREFQRKAAIKSFHCCHVCGKTENDDPSLEFRVGTDGEEYCTDHLPPN